jgi:hypothetical protein
MKQLILLLWFLPLTAHALDGPQLVKLLATAAGATGQPYLEARQAILDLGTNALPLLARAATDPALTWQQRLAARICYERIARGADIEALRRYDWRADPQYDPKWEAPVVGVRCCLGKIAVPTFAARGLWYYYIELAWKDTKECGLPSDPSVPFDVRINNDGQHLSAWPAWCMAAVHGQPERHYLVQALIERLSLDVSLSEPSDADLYRYLLDNKETDAVPVLVERYDAYDEHEEPGSGEAFAGAREMTYRGMFEPIVSLADSRHAAQIEKFIAEKPALAPLQNKLAEVRQRPAHPLVEPPFRLDHRRGSV